MSTGADMGGLQPPMLLDGGEALKDWILAGGLPERRVRLMGLRLGWAAYWFERHWAMGARESVGLSVPTDPTFILGLWRTGSTRLHQLLAETGHLATPTTWQCFRPAAWSLAPPPRERRDLRPMDGFEVATHSPQEDEFAALLLGEPSLYRGFIDPRRLDELLQQADAPLSERWERFLTLVLARRPGPLLLKSPNHTFRLRALASRFPQGRFVWLTRRTTDVVASNMRMWMAMNARYGLWSAAPAVYSRFIDGVIRQHDDLFDWARAALGDRLQIVPFDAVVANEPTFLPGLLDGLGIGRARPEAAAPRAHGPRGVDEGRHSG